MVPAEPTSRPAQFRVDPAARSRTVDLGVSVFKDLPFWVAVAATIIVIALCISRASLWIDEGFTAWLAVHHSLASLIVSTTKPPADASDQQYPLYVAYIWAWCKAFGYSELALRAANLPFAVVYVLAISITCRSILGRRFAWIPFAFAPFMWLYVSEARSYLMLTAFATVAVAAAIAYAYGPPAYRRAAIWFLLIASLLALLSNILGIFLLPGVAVILAAARSDRSNLLWKEWLLPIVVVGPLILATMVFYAFTFMGSAGRAEVLHAQHYSPVASVAQVLYEDAGLDGLGPPRNTLRINPTSIASTYLPWLLLGAALIALAVIQSLREPIDRRFWLMLFAWLSAFALTLLISSVTHDRFLGRHMAAAFPFLIFALMFLLRRRFPLVLLAIAFLVSDFRMTFLPEYWKDDYRGAVADIIAREHNNPGSIDWAADAPTANYYGLALTYIDNPVYTRYVMVDFPREAVGTYGVNLTPQSVEALLRRQRSGGRPVYLAVSKPDLVDDHQAWHRAIERYHAAHVADYRAFSIYVFSES
jgi:hypothetical protein